MKKILLFLSFFLSLSAAAQIKKFEERYPSGKLYVSGFKDKKTGKFEGHWKIYTQEGELIEECDYKDGLEDGKLIRYNPYNIVSSVTEYSKGKKEGKFVKYYEPEDAHDKPPLYITATYHDDEFEGMHYTYEKDGKISKRTRYHEGWVVADTTVCYDGILYEKLEHASDNPDYAYMKRTFVPFKQPVTDSPVQNSNVPKRSQQRKTVKHQQFARPKRKQVKPQLKRPVPTKPKPRLQTDDKGVVTFK